MACRSGCNNNKVATMIMNRNVNSKREVTQGFSPFVIRPCCPLRYVRCKTLRYGSKRRIIPSQPRPNPMLQATDTVHNQMHKSYGYTCMHNSRVISALPRSVANISLQLQQREELTLRCPDQTISYENGIVSQRPTYYVRRPLCPVCGTNRLHGAQGAGAQIGDVRAS